MKLRLAYFGSPDFSAHVLERIIKEIPDISVELVVTQPDRPVGRKHVLTPTPVKNMAQKHKILVFDKIGENHFECEDILSERIRGAANKLAAEPCQSEESDIEHHLSSCDLALVFAYGQIIPDEILKLPKYGFWNIHPSLLPAFRGPSPLVFPILLGYPETGVTLMQMDKKMDHGPIIAQERLTIDPHVTHDLLLTNASDVGFNLFKKEINNLTLDTCSLSPQNDSFATYTKLLKREDGYIPYQALQKAQKNLPITINELPSLWQYYLNKNPNSNTSPDLHNSGKLIYDYYRALHPWPGIWTIKDDKRMKIIEACLEADNFVIRK